LSAADYSERASPGGRRASAADASARDVVDDAANGEPGDEVAVIAIDASGAAGERADRFLTRALAGRVDGLSRSRLQQWIALGAVSCAQRAITAGTRLAGYEWLQVTPLPREADHAFEPDPVELAIVDEDEHLLVLDKPAGLVVHPAAGNWRNTLLNGLLHHRPAQAHLPRAGIVHRLDKDTSGLLVVAKSERAFESLSGQLADRSMSRRYLAFVAGIAPERALIDEPIGRDPRTRVRMAVVRGSDGRPARTAVERLATLRVAGLAASLVECRLETGRTHQIRVHMRHLGHPLLGDALYGGPTAGIARQALHAWRLGLRDPLDGRARHWTSRPPADLRTLADDAGLDLDALLRRLASHVLD